MTDRSLVFSFFLAMGLCAGCYIHHVPEDPGVIEDAAVDDGRVRERARDLDLLIVVDDSGSMAEEQDALRTQLPRLIARLLTGDLDEDGVRDRTPARSLRLGVVSTDMGVRGVGVIAAPLDSSRVTQPIGTCGFDMVTRTFDASRALVGRDGRILLDSPERAQLATEGVTCPESVDRYLTWVREREAEPGAAQVEAFANQATCMLVRGVHGCGLEMQLEATLKAVTSTESPLRFELGATLGHGPPSGAHAGFFRADSVIAILLLSDEDDCSTDDPQVFMPRPDETALQDPAQVGARFGSRCQFFEERLHGVQRYVEGLLAVRERREDLVFGAIVGVPLESDPVDSAVAYDALLARPDMQYRDVFAAGVDFNMDGNDDVRDRLTGLYGVPVCYDCIDRVTGLPVSEEASGGLEACDDDPRLRVDPVMPARRIVSVARGLEAAGVQTMVRSICDRDFSGPIAGFSARILDALGL